MPDRLSQLAVHLSSQHEEIVDRWRVICESDDEMAVVSKLTRSEFRDNIPAAIDGFCRVLRMGDREATYEAIRDEVAKHGHHRWKQGFSLEQLIRDWGHLNRVLLGLSAEFLRRSGEADADDAIAAFDRLEHFMTEAISGSVRRFDDLRRAEAASLARDLQSVKEKFGTLTESRGQMLREAAHDIRGGLSAIAGASAVLKHTQTPTASLLDTLDVLDQGVQSVQDMLNSLLDLSRLESGADGVKLLSVNIATVLRELAAQHSAAASEQGVALHADGPEELCIETDPEKVRRIAQNLLTNALEHTPHGEVRITWTLDSQRWALRVSDTGPGMQDSVGPPVAQELDEPQPGGDTHYDPTAPCFSGEGIGLTIVKRLCDLLDAGVSLESAQGQGTTVTVNFPLGYGDGSP